MNVCTYFRIFLLILVSAAPPTSACFFCQCDVLPGVEAANLHILSVLACLLWRMQGRSTMWRARGRACWVLPLRVELQLVPMNAQNAALVIGFDDL